MKRISAFVFFVVLGSSAYAITPTGPAFNTAILQATQTFTGVNTYGKAILGSTGSATAPAFSFSGSTTTGWYKAAGPSIHGSVSGVDLIGLLSSGLFPSADITSQLGGTGNRWTDTYSSNFHAGYGTVIAPSYSVGLSSMGVLATDDTTLSLVVNKGYASGGVQVNLDLGGLRVFADGSTNPLFVHGSENNDMEIGINNINTGTSAVSLVQAQSGSNTAAITIATFGENYGLPGGTRCGLVSNNLAVLEAGGTDLNGMVIETRKNVPIVFGINDIRTMILSTGSYNAQFQGGVNASSFTATYGVVGATGSFSGLLTVSSVSVTNIVTASSLTATNLLTTASATVTNLLTVSSVSATNVVTASSVTATNLLTTASGTITNLLTVSSVSVSTTLTASTVNVTGRFAGRGTSTNDNACPGCIGEYISSQTAAQGGFSTSAQASLAVVLTPGDWNVVANIDYAAAGSTTTGILAAIGASSASFGDTVTGVNGANFTATTNIPFTEMAMPVPKVRISIASQATYYLNTVATVTAGTPVYRAMLSARRVR